MKKVYKRICSLAAMVTIFAMGIVTPFKCLVSMAADDAATVSSESLAFKSNSASTQLKVKLGDAAATNLSATLPLTVTLAVKANGDVIGPSPLACKLVNTGKVKLYVSKISGAYQSGYTYNATSGANTLNLSISTVSLQNVIYDTAVLKNGNCEFNRTEWGIGPSQYACLAYTGSVGNISADILNNSIHVMTATFTIAAGE